MPSFRWCSLHNRDRDAARACELSTAARTIRSAHARACDVVWTGARWSRLRATSRCRVPAQCALLRTAWNKNMASGERVRERSSTLRLSGPFGSPAGVVVPPGPEQIRLRGQHLHPHGGTATGWVRAHVRRQLDVACNLSFVVAGPLRLTHRYYAGGWIRPSRTSHRGSPAMSGGGGCPFEPGRFAQIFWTPRAER